MPATPWYRRSLGTHGRVAFLLVLVSIVLALASEATWSIVLQALLVAAALVLFGVGFWRTRPR